MTSRTPLVEVHQLRKRFGHHEVLRGVSLEVAEGEVVVIMGPSGSGKSTLLRCLNLLEQFQSGSVVFDGELLGFRRGQDGRLRPLDERRLNRQRRRIGMVFQRFNLFEHMTVMENLIEAPVHVQGVRVAEATERAQKLLDRVGLGDRAHSYPDQLSGGQCQRVAIARALAMRPDLILFDEPTSALDPELVGEVLRVMKDVAEQGITMVVVTHEVAFARAVADRIVFIDDGVVVESGPADTMMRSPEHPRTQAFLSTLAERV